MAIYLASPMASTKRLDGYSFSRKKLLRNKKIAQKLIENGLDVFLPQENQKKSEKLTLEKELRMIRDCEFLIAILSDTRGAYLEAGYAKGLGKKIYGLKVEETRVGEEGKVSEWLAGFFDYIAYDIKELIEYLKKAE